MNSFIAYYPESYKDHQAFVELILSIIDTKLQFIKDKTVSLIHSNSLQFDCPPILQHNIQRCEIEHFEYIFTDESEEVFKTIEFYSKSTNLLFLLRSSLTNENVSRIYDLLSNDRYLHFEHEELLAVVHGSNKKVTSM